MMGRQENHDAMRRSQMETTTRSSVFCHRSLGHTSEHPVETTNRAAKNIRDGDYDAAIVLLTNALKKMKLILSGDAKIQVSTTTDFTKNPESRTQLHQDNRAANRVEQKEDDADRSKGSGLVLEYSFCELSTDMILETFVPVHEHGYRSFKKVRVFTKPLIAKGDLSEVTLDVSCCEELSGVLLFNLALAYQLRAIVSTNARELLKSMNLYVLSQDIFRRHHARLQDPALLTMVLLCNLGHTHIAFGDSKRSRECKEHLLSVLMYTIDESQSQNSPRTQSMMDAFLSIVEDLIISKDSTAPAA